MRLKTLTCDDCGHFFDLKDKRAFISKNEEVTYCPLCTEQRLHGVEAWAGWNSCQGIFADTVHYRRKGAEEASMAIGPVIEEVIPVRLYEEPEKSRWLRHWSEDQREMDD